VGVEVGGGGMVVGAPGCSAVSAWTYNGSECACVWGCECTSRHNPKHECVCDGMCILSSFLSFVVAFLDYVLLFPSALPLLASWFKWPWILQ